MPTNLYAKRRMEKSRILTILIFATSSGADAGAERPIAWGVGAVGIGPPFFFFAVWVVALGP